MVKNFFFLQRTGKQTIGSVFILFLCKKNQLRKRLFKKLL
jgi:hypothetical protein